MVLYTCNSSTWEVKAEGAEILGQFQPHSKFKASCGQYLSQKIKLISWFINYK